MLLIFHVGTIAQIRLPEQVHNPVDALCSGEDDLVQGAEEGAVAGRGDRGQAFVREAPEQTLLRLA